VNEDLDQKSLLRRYERELKRLRAELEERSRSVVDQRRLLELDEQRRRAEEDKVRAARGGSCGRCCQQQRGHSGSWRGGVAAAAGHAASVVGSREPWDGSLGMGRRTCMWWLPLRPELTAGATGPVPLR